MNIAFFGTSDRSIPILERLNKSKEFKLALCVTKNDVKVGRKHAFKETGVKTWAKTNKINYLTFSKLNNEVIGILKQNISNDNIKLAIIADFSILVPEVLITGFEMGMINIHFSLLPKLRGANPVQAAILQNFDMTGITFFLLDKGMDTGPILYKIEYKMTHNEYAGDLYNILFDLAAKNIENVLTDYCTKKITPISQDENEATYFYSKTAPSKTFIYKADAKINWNNNVYQIEREVRAYNPWPVAWTVIKDIFLSPANTKINSAGYALKNARNQSLKLKIWKGEIINGLLYPILVQVEGKKSASWKDFLNGYAYKTA